MYVLCTLAVLTLHGLLRSWSSAGGGGPAEEREDPAGTPAGRRGGRPGVRGPRGGKNDGRRRRGAAEGGKRAQGAVFSPVVMFGSRRSWDAASNLQPLWRTDASLDASSVDFLMSDGEDDGSFLSLPPADTHTPSQLLIQTLQDKVCDFQARLRSEEVSRHLLLQQLQHFNVQEKKAVSPTAAGVRPGEQPSGRLSSPEQQQLVTRLRTQVEELEEKLLNQTEEVERLRSELGATDVEKQLELLLVENERLKEELKSWRDPTHTQQRQHRLAEGVCELEDGGKHTLTLRLQQSEEELSTHTDTHTRGKVDCPSLCLQRENLLLREQLSLHSGLLGELQAQLSQSQRSCSQLRTQILVYEGEMERAQGQLEVEMQNLEEEKNRVIEEAFVRAESEMKAVHENLAGVRMNLLSLQPALRTLTCDYNSLKRQVQDFPLMLDKAITEAKQEICQVISEVSSTNQELLRKYKREMNLRKKCHNELVRLKGNIRVFCRVRPVSQEEQDSADAKTTLSFDSDDDAVLYLSNKGKVMTFDLDKVFPPQATQEEVFQEVQDLVTSCIDGFNICIFAYGQTGSGKTYTMEGVQEDPGINQRALRLLFSEVMEKSPDWDYKITVSMVEIYNETLRNLLGENPSDKLDIKMNPDGSGHLYVPGLTEFTVQSPEDINRVFELGHMNRATACTNLNEHSSRSHALLSITVCGHNTHTGSSTQGKLNLVDLAGSERIAKSGAEGGRLREAQCINKSLSALGDVINALRSKHSHVPFRNSRLTYLLQDSLSGDSKTLMMVQVSPLPVNISESVCSLKFAQRVRSVELSSSSSRKHENSSTSSSPTHDSIELDSPPVTPLPLPLSRASSAGSTLSSRTPSSTRRKSQTHLSTGRLKTT